MYINFALRFWHHFVGNNVILFWRFSTVNNLEPNGQILVMSSWRREWSEDFKRTHSEPLLSSIDPFLKCNMSNNNTTTGNNGNIRYKDNRCAHSDNRRSLQEYLQSDMTRYEKLSCLHHLPVKYWVLQKIKSKMVQVLLKFYGMDKESPNIHLHNSKKPAWFLTTEQLNLKLLPFLLKDKKKIWQHSSSPDSITTENFSWDNLDWTHPLTVCSDKHT